MEQIIEKDILKCDRNKCVNIANLIKTSPVLRTLENTVNRFFLKGLIKLSRALKIGSCNMRHLYVYMVLNMCLGNVVT